MKKFLIFVAVLASLFLWSACGDDKTVYYPSAAVSEVVENFDDLKTCADKNNGDMVYVRNDLTTYRCDLKKWKVVQEYDAVSSSGKGKKSSSSSSDKSSKKSSSSVSSKDASSSSKTKSSSSSVDEESSSSEEDAYSSSSDVVLSSSSVFVCADDWYCSRVEEKCDETVIDSFTVFTYNDKTYYYQCKAGGWMPSDLVKYDTYGKSCTSDADTIWGIRDFYDLKDSLNPYRNFYTCQDGELEPLALYGNTYSAILTFFNGTRCDDFHQNVVVQKKYSSFSCHGYSWYLDDQYTGTMVDDRDGKEYRTVGIGDHIWMQENLMFTKGVPAVEYGTYSVKQGPHYNWYTAANVSEKEWTNNPLEVRAPIQGICPDGWHLPTRRNFMELSSAIHGMAMDHFDWEKRVTECYLGSGYKSFMGNYFIGKDCMNMQFKAVAKLGTSGYVAKNDSGHTTAMWRGDAYKDYTAGSLHLSNAMYHETSTDFVEFATDRMESFEVIRCVKDEEGEHIYKSPYDIPQ